tara:strand:- start:851 stop:1498 length:648 start_codon:yes stop_codon:yes gene_type:complete
MKLNGFIVGLFILSSTTLNAQDWSTGKYKYGEQYEGYVVDINGDRIDGFIKYRNRAIMQDEVIFYGDKDNASTKKKYAVSDLAEFKVADKHYHCIPYSGSNGVQLIKANLVVSDEGCIKTYVWYDRASGYKSMKKRAGESDEDYGNRKFPSVKVYFKSTDGMGVTKDFFSDDFKKKMASYTSDNKELSKKVKKGENGYSERNFMAILKEFNESCN